MPTARMMVEHALSANTHVGAAADGGFEPQILEALPAAVYTCDKGGRITQFNRAAAELWGRSPRVGEELWCGSWRIYKPDGSPLPLDDCPMAITLREGRSVNGVEIIIERPDGTRRNVLPYPQPLHDASGAVVGAVNMLVDLTEHRQAEHALRANEHWLRLATHSGKLGVWEWDIPVNRVDWSDSLFAIHGVTRESFAGTVEGFSSLVHPEDREAVGLAIRRALGDDAPFEIEFRAIRPDGGIVWLFTNAAVMRRDGLPIRMLGATMDITERKQAELALHASKVRTTELLEGLPHLIWTCRPDGACDFLSRQWIEYTGIAEAAQLGFGWLEQVHPDDRAGVSEAWNAAVESERRGEPPDFRVDFRIRRHDGVYRWFATSAQPLRDAKRTLIGWVGSNADITGQREQQQAFREETLSLEALNNVSQSLREHLDLDRLMQSVTDAGRQLTQAEFGAFFCNAAEPSGGESSMRYTVSGAPMKAFSHLPLPRATEILALAFRGERIMRSDDITSDPRYGRNTPFTGMPTGHLPVRSYLAAPVIARSGETLGALFYGHSTPGVFGERAERLLAGIAGQTAVAIDNARLYAEQKRTSIDLADHRDRLNDLVHERTHELERSHQRLRMSERMASLGTLSAGLGHDMGNLLLPVRVRLETLTAADLPAQCREDIAAIRTAADYLQRLASGLRMLAVDPHRSRPNEVIELAAWWKDAELIFKNAVPKGIALQHRPLDGPCYVCMSQTPLTQVIFNLVQNAGDAMRERGRGCVTVSVRRDDTGVHLSVADDGPGMSEETRRRCMEPFYTTKTRSISTGLGLALVYGLVQEAAGTVSIESVPGQGSVFTLHLRAGRSPPQRGNADGLRSRAAVVDLCDARLKAFASAELRLLGFEVNGAGGDAPALVVSDVAQSSTPTACGPRRVLLEDGADATSQSSLEADTIVLSRRPRPRELSAAIRFAAARIRNEAKPVDHPSPKGAS